MSFPENSATVQFQTDTASMAFCFQTGANLPCAFLAGNAAPECWNMGENFRFVQVYIQETGDLLADTKRAYTELLARVRGSTHAHLIRIWNYFAEINHGDEDAERYRQFCVGRAQAVDLTFNNPPPAATAIGYRGENTGLQVIALCSNSPAIALENARQTPAWQYPRQYGKVSPGFSRGAVLFAETESPILLASGTASIVGPVSYTHLRAHET
jgi:chorismate lyase/3-hydroxybenzoate synthase